MYKIPYTFPSLFWYYLILLFNPKSFRPLPLLIFFPTAWYYRADDLASPFPFFNIIFFPITWYFSPTDLINPPTPGGFNFRSLTVRSVGECRRARSAAGGAGGPLPARPAGYHPSQGGDLQGDPLPKQVCIFFL